MHIWDVLGKGGILILLERLYGGKSKVIQVFLQNWIDLMVNRRNFSIMDKNMSKIIGILIAGNMFYSDRKISNSTVDTFLRMPK